MVIWTPREAPPCCVLLALVCMLWQKLGVGVTEASPYAHVEKSFVRHTYTTDATFSKIKFLKNVLKNEKILKNANFAKNPIFAKMPKTPPPLLHQSLINFFFSKN
jgi:hypothetical protein